MPCFDPEDVIFITNKWDSLPKVYDSSDDSEDEDTVVWRTLNSDIRATWEQVKDENIFKLNLIEVIFSLHERKT